MNEYPSVSIIIPNFNGRPFIKRCLRSVLQTDYPAFEVIVVDDGSTDGSIDLIKDRFSSETRLKIIRNERNLGAAGARNVAIEQASGELFCFLDNDTKVDPSWLTEMVNTMMNDEFVGAVQGMILEFTEPEKIQHAGIIIIPYVGWAVAREQGRSVKEVNNHPCEVGALTTALLVKREAFDRIGGFDEKLAIYTEDLDFAWRMWISGYKILLEPKAKVWHWNKPLSMRRRMLASETQFNFHLTKNSLRTLIKNYQFKNLIKYLPSAFLILIARAILVLVKRHNPFVILGTLKGIAWNLACFKDTWKERLRIQKLVRRVKDECIMTRIMVSGNPVQIYRRQFAHTGLL